MKKFLPDRNYHEPIPPGGLTRRFGDLKVRPKLMILHNLFFLVLACAVYFSLIPLIEQRIESAKSREISLITQMFSEVRPLLRLPGMEIYDYQEGPSKALGVPWDVLEWLDSNPGSIWQDRARSDAIYRKNLRNGAYRKLRLPHQFYDELMHRAKITLFLALGIIYLFAVWLLERVIMPYYVYRPIRLMLKADAATRQGDREHELIEEKEILGDEIGQIMASRNATIVQLRQQEDDLARKNHLLETQDRLVSLGMLSASVAHELNTPLAVLQGSIEKLAETVDDQHAQERLARMLRVAQRLRKMSESLVDFARVRKQDAERVYLRPLVEESWSLVAIDEKASTASFLNAVSEDTAVAGNPDRLIQVFVNLLRNALLAIQSGGTIVVRSAAVYEGGRTWISVRVEDDGEGIPAEVLPELFEAFVSTRLDSRGTGLGLTVADGIVRQHGGTIAAMNRTEGGACLEVKLPAAH